MVDPIADMLNRLITAQAVKKETVEVPFSKLTYAIAKILEKNGFVKHVDFKGKRTRKIIEIEMRYQEGIPRIEGTKRVSKPGQRVYTPVGTIKRARGGGIMIISTSKGLLTHYEAKMQKVGGEVLLEVW